MINKHLSDNPRTALVITQPAPGLKEQRAQELADQLAAKKAAMSAEEIEALVAATAAYTEQSDSDASQYVAQLQAAKVDSLPEEKRIYQISDQTGDDQVRRMSALAEVSGVGQALVLLDAGALPQEDLHWFKLYTDLLGKLDTHQRDNAALSAQMTRYLNSLEMRPTVYVGDQRDQCLPYLRLSWIAMDEDMPAAYDLIYETAFDSKLDDAQRLAELLGQVKNTLKQTITNTAFEVQIYRAFASAAPGFTYYDYMTYVAYYNFLLEAEALFASDPEAALQRLASVRDQLKVSTGAVSAFAGSAEGIAAHREVADAFLSKLDVKQREKAS